MDKNLPARPVEVRCMIQGFRSRCTGTTQRDGIGREVRDRGDTCELVAGSCKCMTKTTTISSVQSLSRVRLFATPRTAAHRLPAHYQLPELAQTHVHQSVMPSNHLILCCSLLLLPSVFPNIRVFSNELVLGIRWPKYWSLSFRISPSSEYLGLV